MIYFQVVESWTEMTNEKDNLSNYGLDVKLFLDEKLFFDGNLENPSGLEKTIGPNESYSFYVVAISNLGINGVIRSGFELRKQNLIHKLNDREFQCGQIIVKK